MKVAVLFDRFGPYHIARLEAAAKYISVIPIEISGETSEYQWTKVESANLQNRITLFQTQESTALSPNQLSTALKQKLQELNPDVVAVNGWYDRSALVALEWCLEQNIPAVVMSESAEEDDKRTWWKEAIKRKLVQQFNAALVGGERHKDYLVKMGIGPEKIFLGYDAVDNGYFIQQSDKARANKEQWQQSKGLPENYFLVVSRFIEKKNLPFVIKAYEQYHKQTKATPWHLYILGDGPMKEELLQLVQSLGLQDVVHFEGFKQYDELPIYFGLAKAFIHASTTEQWGLVVNEAMASGLPVIVSQRCGCAPELVHNGVNGFAIDPKSMDQLTQTMLTLTSGGNKTEEMGKQSRKIVAAYDADAFGKGLQQAASVAIKNRKRRSSGLSKYLLKTLINR